MKPTKKQFKAIEGRFLKATGIEIVQSLKWYNILQRRLAEQTLKAMGITKAKEFLAERFLMVQVGSRKIICAPRKLGKYPIRDICMLTHEYTHFLQRKRYGTWGYEYPYATNPTFRMDVEVEAYASEIPVRGYLGEYRKPREIFDPHFGELYMVKSTLVDYAREEYKDREREKQWDTRYPAARLMLKIIKEVME